ncbi:hypothetical protein I7I48_04803 [Histoplasma ohiense]|nr:hypothetical protein I7I48_04803 [Histoplasma ohiense (nom. inval.)]
MEVTRTSAGESRRAQNARSLAPPRAHVCTVIGAWRLGRRAVDAGRCAGQGRKWRENRPKAAAAEQERN